MTGESKRWQQWDEGILIIIIFFSWFYSSFLDFVCLQLYWTYWIWLRIGCWLWRRCTMMICVSRLVCETGFNAASGGSLALVFFSCTYSIYTVYFDRISTLVIPRRRWRSIVIPLAQSWQVILTSVLPARRDDVMDKQENESQWKSTKINENQWESMKINGNQWKLIKVWTNGATLTGQIGELDDDEWRQIFFLSSERVVIWRESHDGVFLVEIRFSGLGAVGGSVVGPRDVGAFFIGRGARHPHVVLHLKEMQSDCCFSGCSSLHAYAQVGHALLPAGICSTRHWTWLYSTLFSWARPACWFRRPPPFSGQPVLCMCKVSVANHRSARLTRVIQLSVS